MPDETIPIIEPVKHTVDVYASPVRYLAEDGTYQPIELELVATADGWECRTVESPITITDEGVISIEHKDGTFSYQLTGIGFDSDIVDIDGRTAEVDTTQTEVNVLLMSGLTTIGSVEYCIHDNGVKENIYVTDPIVVPENSNFFRVRYDMGQGIYNPVVKEDGELYLPFGNTGSGITCHKPFIYDYNYNYGVASYSVENGDVFVNIPSEWLRNAVYPIVIDPVTTTASWLHLVGTVNKSAFFLIPLPVLSGISSLTSAVFSYYISADDDQDVRSNYLKTIKYLTNGQGDASWPALTDYAIFNSWIYHNLSPPGTDTGWDSGLSTTYYRTSGSSTPITGDTITVDLTGSSSNEHCIAYYYASGRNGKSDGINAILHADYFTTTLGSQDGVADFKFVSFAARSFVSIAGMANADTSKRPKITLTYETSNLKVYAYYYGMMENF